MSRSLRCLILLQFLLVLGCGGGGDSPTAPSTGAAEAPKTTTLKVGKKQIKSRSGATAAD